MWKTSTPDYCVTGSSDTTVYLLHGLYGSKAYWQPLTQRLVRYGFRVVAWDAPGYGAGPVPPDFSLEAASVVLARLIARTGTRRNILFGHSMGGSIGLRAYPLIPGLIDGFIMCCSVGYVRPDQRDAFFAARQLDTTDRDDIERKNLAVVTAMMAPDAKGDYVELVKRVGAGTPAYAVQMALKAIREAPDQAALDALAMLRVPSLFIAGERDSTSPAAAIQKNAQRVSGSQFTVIPGCGHYPWAETPDVFWEVLAPFLDQWFGPNNAGA